LPGESREPLSFKKGRQGLLSYLRQVDALPLHDSVPFLEGTPIERNVVRDLNSANQHPRECSNT
jgi:hypothetical protein